MSAEPLLAIFVPLEGRVVVREFSDTRQDQRRLLLDVDHRADLLAEIEAAVEHFLKVLRHRHGQETP